ncbi:hypothetical protein MSG28_002439 [Choristoneura fumiferana]|uniref:Uncharacterized protein n=1 Tax=Choristoneura fumiferana TaxID=7141 RepID=A0ACC0JVZ0_CHOFU|nr:hypothetical protein MSG28_002439 [Choristoneura fumiferana]
MHILEIGADQEEDGGSTRIAEAAFRTVPKDHTTFLVWRITFELELECRYISAEVAGKTESGTELLPRTHYGTFYDGDAYLIYSASMPGQPAGPDVIRREVKENGNGECAERHIHAWGGERSGALAALALRRGAQLAGYLAAPAVLHREAAARESPRLLSYFRDGIRLPRRPPCCTEKQPHGIRCVPTGLSAKVTEPETCLEPGCDTGAAARRAVGGLTRRARRAAPRYGRKGVAAPAVILPRWHRTGILLRGCDEGARLFVVRGRRPVLVQLQPVSWAQLAADGVFLLDAPALLVLWLGRAANLIEKMFGAKIAYRMARGADKGMTARRIAIAHDGYEQTLPAADRALLDALLELRARAVRPAAPPPAAPRAARLYRAVPPRAAPAAAPSQRPAARLEEVKRAPLYREDLADDLAGRLSGRPVVCARVALAAGAADKGRVLLGVGRVAERALKQKTVALPASGLQVGVYIVDAGSRGVWAWVGPAAGGAAARGALAAARGLARARRHAGPVSAAPAAREPLEFAALFANWRWCDKRRDNRLRVARSATTRLDAVSLAANAWLAAEAQLPDDGSGALRVWRVRAGGAAEVERAQAAVFFAADCFLVLYTYHAPTGDQSILYYWMGGSSPNDLRNLGATEAKDLYIKLGRLPVQAWVYQGKEPAHFLQIFKGRMITYVGSADDYDRPGFSDHPPPATASGRRVVAPARALIRVSGQYAREARGAEVRAGARARARARRAPATCCATPRAPGSGAPPAPPATSARSPRTWPPPTTRSSCKVTEAMENTDDKSTVEGRKEKPDFWAAIGDRRELLVAAPLQEVERPLPPRLFYVSLGLPGQYTCTFILNNS